MCIQTKAILVELSLTAFSTSKTDKNVTQETLSKKSATTSAGKWTTKLFPKHVTTNITKHDGQIRAFHYDNTLPWSDKGARILPAKNFNKYMDTMRDMERTRTVLIQDFIDNYQRHRDDARSTNGALFNAAHYPSAQEAGRQYSFHLKPTPIPDKADFRVDLSRESDLQDIQQNLDQQISDAVKIAENDLVGRILTPLNNLAEKLYDPEYKFKDSLVSNLHHILQMLPNLNVTDNPDLSRLADQVEKELGHYTPDILRNSPSDRAIASRKAQKIVNDAQAWA